jgi:Transposase DDE domain
MGVLLEALEHGYRVLRLDRAAGGDEVWAGRVPAHGLRLRANRAETKTMLPVIEKFMAAHQLPDVTVVADAGMISEANMKAIEAAGLSFILGMKVPDAPYVVDAWRREHPGEEIPDGHVFTQPWPAGPKDKRRDQAV